jgi:FkbM family methyltransferase
MRRRTHYAQHLEDAALEMCLGRVERFIDVGANNGMTCSNTFYFALRNAAGLLFEPTPAPYHWLALLYKRQRQIICVNEGLSNTVRRVEFRIEGLLSFATETEDVAHTQQDAEYFSSSQTLVDLPVKPLNYWLERYPQFRSTDFVSLDVEGHELQVLQGIDFNAFKTRCFVIETHGKTAEAVWLHKDFRALEETLNTHGYRYGMMSPLNSFWFHESVHDTVDCAAIVRKLPGYSTMKPAMLEASR